jgi:hypothetical protein
MKLDIKDKLIAHEGVVNRHTLWISTEDGAVQLTHSQVETLAGFLNAWLQEQELHNDLHASTRSDPLHDLPWKRT